MRTADLSIDDLGYLRRCVALAGEALAAGDEPFGSVLVSADGEVFAEDRNRASGDPLAHPEIALARWAVAHLDSADRAAATVYTSGEHCPMCSAAHAWAGLGAIVYATSAAQLAGWLSDWQSSVTLVATLPISAIAPGVPVAGPAPELEDAMKALYRSAYAP